MMKIATAIAFAVLGQQNSLVEAAPTFTKVVSWNAAGGDRKFRENPQAFFNAPSVQKADIVLLQEMAGHTRSAGIRKGWTVERGGKGIAVLYNKARFQKEAPISCSNVSGSAGGRDGHVCSLLLKGRRGSVLVTNVHAGHNGTPRRIDTRSAEKARRQIINHQVNYVRGKRVNLVIAGGDHNELGLYLGGSRKSSLMGATKFGGARVFGKTHHMGAPDLIFANHSGTGKQLGKFGSDHTAISAIIKS